MIHWSDCHDYPSTIVLQTVPRHASVLMARAPRTRMLTESSLARPPTNHTGVISVAKATGRPELTDLFASFSRGFESGITLDAVVRLQSPSERHSSADRPRRKQCSHPLVPHALEC
jgi:hypothetical protein